MPENNQPEDTAGTSVKRVREKPILTTVGKRQVISTGRWNDLVIADYRHQSQGTPLSAQDIRHVD